MQLKTTQTTQAISDPTLGITPAEALVQKHLVPNASKVIVHIKILTPDPNSLGSTSLSTAANLVGNEFAVTKKILGNAKLTEVVMDGMTSREAQDTNNLILAKRSQRALPTLGPKGEADLFSKLSVNGISFVGVEDPNARAEYMNKYSQDELKPSFNEKINMKARDTIMINSLMERKAPVEVVMLGAMHNLVDEVNNWNQKNPSKKISLIEVTPKPLPNRLPDLQQWIIKNFPEYANK